ncbi:hypothetical protein GCM10011309_12980 [Litorimonas cladophorae]|uniref:Poly(Hydroxyalkanoate) granule-associated protein n=1 Tax=Litorimonas cladophorae TaxID=1220491 RepID=A0A918KI23_9PROT|nr:phasin family protein [Litorimonas cladophorae]GGX64280.1 hypothetical protein GCM10011309_12980 [Litorimonas cladophorae]
MSDKKKPDEKDAIRKVWLAGIGAYGRAFAEAKGAVGTLTGKSSEVFDELVSKGEMLEAVGKYKAEELVGKGKAAMGDIKPDLDIDDRIARMRARLSSVTESSTDRLEARVDQLEAKLDAILEKMESGVSAKTSSSRKAAPKRKPAAKTASKKRATTQKTTATKKPAAKKPAAK